MPRDSRQTREKLMRAALHLFARQGLDVPIRDIQILAGQRNATALKYHFGGKLELIQAILEKEAPGDEEIQAVRRDLAARQHDPRSVVEAIVERFRTRLATPEGRDFIRFSFQLVTHLPVRRALIENVDHPSLTSMQAESALVRAALPSLPEAVVRERAVAGMAFITLQLADRARLIDDEDGEVILDEDAFVTNLVDMTTAMLTAPLAGTEVAGRRRRRVAAG